MAGSPGGCEKKLNSTAVACGIRVRTAKRRKLAAGGKPNQADIRAH